ncbi:MAG: hypothetical protein WC530_10190 [Candidatus Omnitrophota bacterium]
MKDKDRTTSGQGLLEEKERGVEGERGNPRRGFPSGDEAQARSLRVDKSSILKWDGRVETFGQFRTLSYTEIL